MKNMEPYVTLYMDDSGQPDWSSPHGGSPDRHYTMGGIILTPKQDIEARDGILELLHTHIPSEARRIRPQREYELHMAHMLSRSGIYRKMGSDAINDLMAGIYRLFDKLRPTILATTIDKIKEREQWGEQSLMPKETMTRSVIHKFSMYLTYHGKTGSIIYDQDKPQSMLDMQDRFYEYRKTGVQIGSRMSPDRCENILNNVLSCSSHFSPGIQLADFVAHSAWKRYEKGIGEYYDKLDPYWERRDRRTFGDSLIP